MTERQLIDALCKPDFFDHPVEEIKLVETHISWVILTGRYAYKIKKPINLGFLDFSTLEKRHQFCQQEVALNQRLAPQLYLGVVPIGGTAEAPLLHQTPAMEYAVKMRQFHQCEQLDEVLSRGELCTTHIDALADTISQFHKQIEHAGDESNYGDSDTVIAPVEENFRQIEPLLSTGNNAAQIQYLKQWSLEQHRQLHPIFEQRKRDGYIRNCHGDMHLANIALINNDIVIFDCIEFNNQFRWIDVLSEIAFTSMDLIDRGRPDYAARLLDRYLQRTGDYQGLSVYTFYLVYRALVRAKVAIIRSHQVGISQEQQHQALEQFKAYCNLAEFFTKTCQPILYIAHGVSGSGKTTLTQALIEKHNMIRLRSDIERKRLFNLEAEEKSSSSTGNGIYNSNASQRTYQTLYSLAHATLTAGISTIVDATFLKKSDRIVFRQLASELQLPFVILSFHADEQLLRQWIRERAQKGKDASEATEEVLTLQLSTEEPLETNEAEHIISVDTGRDDAIDILLEKIESLIYSHKKSQAN